MERVKLNVIEKENINNLQFKSSEVLTDKCAQQQRQQDLYRGMVLGNAYKSKVQIVFESLAGLNMVTTTIWATTDKNVVLKGGLLIPICCIMEVIC
jgi:hypothetical protein